MTTKTMSVDLGCIGYQDISVTYEIDQYAHNGEKFVHIESMIFEGVDITMRFTDPDEMYRLQIEIMEDS